MKEVIYTKGIPICPDCDKPTHRTDCGRISTNMSISHNYDEKGNDTWCDPNTYIHTYFCQNCGKEYGVKSQNGESKYVEGLKPVYS